MARLSPKSLIILLLLLTIFSLRAIHFIKEKSITFDEIIYPAAGYACWTKHDYSINLENPPLAKLLVSFPLLFLRPNLPSDIPPVHPYYQFLFGDRFFAENVDKRELMVFLSRAMVLLLSLILALALFIFSRRLFGEVPALISLFLYTFSPNILAHSGLSTIDLIIGLFLFLFVLFFCRTLKEHSLRWVIFTGVILGLALLTKNSALLLLPLLFIFIFLARLKGDLESPHWERSIEYTGIVLVVGAIIIILGYGVIYFAEYLRGLSVSLPMVTTPQGIYQVYLAGRYSQGGWWYYYLAVFLMKTPLPVIILTVFALISLWKRKTLIKYPDLIYPLTAALIIFLCISWSKHQAGMRFLIPVYPFLFLWLGEEALSLWQGKRWQRPLVILLCLWYIISSVAIHPHYLAYFNELIGGPKRGYKYLTDCNIDWGQDLKGLKKYLEEEGNPPIILSYFGNDDPSYYGIKYQEFAVRSRIPREGEIIELSDKRQLLAVSATNLTGIYYPGQENFYWWLKTEKPVDIIGYSIFVYDITHNPTAFIEMGKLYYSQMRLEEAEIMFKKMVKLEPEKTESNLLIAQFYKDTGRKEEAKKYFEKVLELDPKNFQAKEELKQL